MCECVQGACKPHREPVWTHAVRTAGSELVMNHLLIGALLDAAHTSSTLHEQPSLSQHLLHNPTEPRIYFNPKLNISILTAGDSDICVLFNYV